MTSDGMSHTSCIEAANLRGKEVWGGSGGMPVSDGLELRKVVCVSSTDRFGNQEIQLAPWSSTLEDKRQRSEPLGSSTVKLGQMEEKELRQ